MIFISPLYCQLSQNMHKCCAMTLHLALVMVGNPSSKTRFHRGSSRKRYTMKDLKAHNSTIEGFKFPPQSGFRIISILV